MTDLKDQSNHNHVNEECIDLIYNSVIDMYNIEWQKTHDIENKASSIIGFVGIIFSLIIVSLSAIISSTDPAIKERIFSATYLLILIFLILILLTLSVLCGIMVLLVKDWMFLKVDEFIDYCITHKLTRIELSKILTEDFKINIVENRKQNRKIANWLQASYILFMLSIFLLFVYFALFLSILK